MPVLFSPILYQFPFDNIEDDLGEIIFDIHITSECIEQLMLVGIA
jgi:hypothetical protein